MGKLSRKDAKVLSLLATTPDLKDKLNEYIDAEKAANKLWKEFREAVVNGEGVKEKSPNELRAEVEVEKAVKSVETKRKFKAGDKVRVNIAGLTHNQLWDLATTDLENGAITEVIGYKEDDEAWTKFGNDGRPVVVKEVGEYECGFFDESVLELVEEKSPNELRAEVIQRAKEFVKENEYVTIKKGSLWSRWYVTQFEFVVNTDKRAVVALLKSIPSNKVVDKGVTKCNPDDVFNEHIGKAIALGRALGKDVSEFENTVQPNKMVADMKIRRETDGSVFNAVHLYPCNGSYTILDDTNAKY